MPCEMPRKAFQRIGGGAVAFNKPNDGHIYNELEIPCGRCILCQQEKARQWGVRITHEAKQWETSSFITLSYDQAHIPEHGSLCYADLVKFWKRLRKEIGTLRYYAVGEYGDQSLRPHYHACLFGHDFTDRRIILRERPSLLWTSPLLAEIWGKGLVSIGALNFQTAQYTASYVLKKLATGQQYVRIDEATGELIPLEQPRSFMSRNLALEWWTRYGEHSANHDFVVINGRKQKPPKAYDRWLEKKDANRMHQIKEERKANAPEETEEQRHARARNAHARAKRKNKEV